MSKKSETNFITNCSVTFSECFQLPNPGLRSYFGRVREGQSEVYRSPFCKDQDPQSVVDAWFEHLSPLKQSMPGLYDFESDLRSKVGPLSVMKPLEERLTDIDHYYDDILLPSEPVSTVALKAVDAEFSQIKGLRPRGQDKTSRKMTMNTNSGSPYFTKRSRVLTKTVPASVEGCVQYLAGEEFGSCAILGWRGQEGGPSTDDVKQRVVWMFPLSVNLCELQVYQPLIESAQRFGLVPGWIGQDSVDARVSRLFDTKSSKDLVICSDFSKFDQHFNSSMQDCAQSILTSLMTPNSDSVEWLERVFPIKYNIPLSYDWNTLRIGPHGMGSGSGGTNADETLAHRALQHEVAIRNNAKLNPSSMCLGDDGILTYPGITVDQVVDSYSSHGQEMNASKQFASTDSCIYLRRWYHANYRVGGITRGVYSTCRALGKLMYMERFMDPKVWGAKAVALRQLSIIENVKWHPYKEQFAQFCMERDKFRLGLDIPDFLSNLEQEAHEVIDAIPDALGYVRQQEGVGGINNWWIVQWLRSKR